MKYKALAALAICAVSTQALAVGVEDLAKVVLGGNSVLKKAQSVCGKSGSLSLSEITALDTAVSAAQRALLPERFSALDQVARADADTQSQSNTFCPETKKKKKGLLGKIGKAGKKLILGGMGL